jgi:hypothetical protein
VPGVAAQRLAAQRIARPDHRSPAALVAWMGAIQAQDPAGARWAVALRLAGKPVAEQEILGALQEGSIIRTHVMRWTWQLVTPADLHWMLPLVAARLFQRAARRFRELGLDQKTLGRSRAILERALRDGAHLTRDELRAALEAGRVSAAAGGRLSHLLAHAELQGVICSGAPRGAAATYALLETRAPRPASPWSREESLAELARRYFRSRGPATVADFTWWSGLSPAEARAAAQSVESELARQEIDGYTAWADPDAGRPRSGERAHLVPPFDEILVAYKDRAALLDPAHARRLNAGGGMLAPSVVLGGRVGGIWRRTMGRTEVAVSISAFDRLTRTDRDAVAQAAERYARFLGLKLALAFRADG